MKRVRKVSDPTKAEFLLQRNPPRTPHPPYLSNTSPNYRLINHITSRSHATSVPPTAYPTLLKLFTAKEPTYYSPETEDDAFIFRIAELSDELAVNQSDLEKISQILEAKAPFLIQRSRPVGSAFVDLLLKLKPWPQLALQVFNWRREEEITGIGMVAEEYSKGITIAGRVKDIDLAVKLFSEACAEGIKTSGTYNALMGVYMYNDLPDKAQAVFKDLKREISCGPTLVTYNILLAVFGRLMLVDHMEAIFTEIQALKLTPNVHTYNNVIAGYVTAWMWEDMERIFEIMEKGPVKPDFKTHLLMLRGYAHSVNLDKMEKTYRLIKPHVDEKNTELIRAMICAYCKSSEQDRITKVETLLKVIPEEDYRPWLNVILIRLYAQEGLMDGMNRFIDQAIEHNTSIITTCVMRSVIATYFQCNAVESFDKFLKHAESSGWKVSRSLYHSKMCMYASANRMDEMENILEEMGRFNLDPTRKTFMILYKSYSKWGQRSKAERLLGTMCKHGFDIPLDAFPS